jgi:hypothetical protein
MSLIESVKHPTYLKTKATKNHALNAYAYGPWPHLFIRLACTYNPPPEMILVLLYLWDKTVGSGSDCGCCALSQIPVHHRYRSKWLAALVAVGFFDCDKAKRGGKHPKDEAEKGSFYIYNNPTADEWDRFFQVAYLIKNFGNWELISTNDFADMFARAFGKAVAPPPAMQQ